MFVSTKFLQAGLILVSKTGKIPIYNNTLAYFAIANEEKNFLTLASGVKVIKLFFFVTEGRVK